MKPLTLDESADGEVPETLEILMQSVLEERCKDERTVVNHLFVVVLCTLMMECGFSPMEEGDRVEAATHVVGFDIRLLRSVLRMPPCWWSEQDDRYWLKFHLRSARDRHCLFSVAPLSFATVVNVVVPGETGADHVISFPDIRQYVTSDHVHFSQLKALSRLFKDSVVVPVRSRLLSASGLLDAHLASMPDEILLLVTSFLGYKDLVFLSLTCQRLNKLCKDDSLWKPLCIAKFSAQVTDRSNSLPGENWYSLFKSLFMQSASSRSSIHVLYYDDYFDIVNQIIT